MKTKAICFASRLLTMAFAVCVSLSFAACGDDDEPSVDEILSDKTTPVTFKLENRKYFLFDFAGSHYVGSDTLNLYRSKTADKTEIELRQGQHHLLWFKGLSTEEDYWDDFEGVRFDPATQTVKSNANTYGWRIINYAECDIKVPEYLLPPQKLEWNMLNADVVINITDQELAADKVEKKHDASIGTIDGLPNVSSLTIHGDNYILSDDPMPIKIRTDYYNGGGIYKGVFSIKLSHTYTIFCPESGFHNVQLTPNILDTNGNRIATTAMPSFSLRRGYITVLTGPLFSGSTSDWTVEYEPFDEEGY